MPKRNKWFIAFKKRSEDIFDLSNLKIIPNPNKDTYWADPFVIKWEEKNYLFFEWYDYKKGRIACINLDDWTAPQIVLEEDYHLSFPGVFQDNGKLYMVPESGANGTIDLYEGENPFTWKKVKTLVEGVYAADPIITKREGGYWLHFTNAGDENLEIYYSTLLSGNFEKQYSAQEANSRNAGNHFYHNGEWLKPKQDSKKYGKRIYFKNFHDEIEHTIEPDWERKLTGTHTFNFNDDYVVIDGRYEETVDSN